MSEPSGWLYGHVRDPEVQRALVRKVGVVYVLDTPSNEMQAIGACFRVHNSLDIAICFTAAHVVEAAIRMAAPRRFKNGALEDLPEAERVAVAKRMIVHFGDLPYGEAPQVIAYNLTYETDLAVLIVQFPRAFPIPPPSVFAINSDLFRPGTKVMAVAPTDITPGSRYRDLRVSAYEISPSLQVRAGEIAGLQKGRLVRVPLYETNIPLLGGMSGGPVLLAPGPDKGPMSVVGVISSDFSTEDSHTNPGTVGCSCVVPIAYGYGISTGVDMGDGPLTVKELCNRKAVIDVGKRRDRISLTGHLGKFEMFVPPWE